MKMKIKLLYLTLLITVIKSPNLFCLDRKPTHAPLSKAAVDTITKTKSKRDLARENLELRTRLTQEHLARQGSQTKLKTDELQSPTPDLEMGLGSPAPTGIGTGLLSRPPMRRRTVSTLSDDGVAGSVDGLHGTVADFLALQQTQNELQRRSDQDRTIFQDKVYRDVKYSRRTAIAGTFVAICYTTAGFVWQNWGAISSVLGGGPSGSDSNSTGT